MPISSVGDANAWVLIPVGVDQHGSEHEAREDRHEDAVLLHALLRGAVTRESAPAFRNESLFGVALETVYENMDEDFSSDVEQRDS
ncbi:unnamed protein product [Dibothriocephalus latus]|uniref:Uncharacterized protein n=1 Tax=Dibothriocephalus latus TaxID=60516 RepID=A0A3P7LVF9_DIBLA|nr:unnamed protein product [Dibothriocephalus latus]